MYINFQSKRKITYSLVCFSDASGKAYAATIYLLQKSLNETKSDLFTMFCAHLFICALWSPAGKGLTSWLSFVVSSVSLSLSHWYPGSGVVLDCIDS